MRRASEQPGCNVSRLKSLPSSDNERAPPCSAACSWHCCVPTPRRAPGRAGGPARRRTPLLPKKRRSRRLAPATLPKSDRRGRRRRRAKATPKSQGRRRPQKRRPCRRSQERNRRRRGRRPGPRRSRPCHHRAARRNRPCRRAAPPKSRRRRPRRRRRRRQKTAIKPCQRQTLCGNQTVRRVHREFFTKSFLGDDAAVLALSSGEEPASPRHRAGVASMAWRTTR